MIRSVIFDLDGTLVKTEWLKSLSYAHAVQRLSPAPVSVEAVQQAFAEVVGRSRDEVSRALAEGFGLEGARGTPSEPQPAWQALAELRLQIYAEMLADPELLRANQWPHTVELLRVAASNHCSTALASMSSSQQVSRVLEAVELQGQFDLVLSREDVECPKPDPEIYRLAAERLHRSPKECLVIEDSPVGVQAAVAAGMHCVAVATPFTHAGLHRQTWLPREWVVDDPAELAQVVDRLMRRQAR